MAADRGTRVQGSIAVSVVATARSQRCEIPKMAVQDSTPDCHRLACFGRARWIGPPVVQKLSPAPRHLALHVLGETGALLRGRPVREGVERNGAPLPRRQRWHKHRSAALIRIGNRLHSRGRQCIDAVGIESMLERTLSRVSHGDLIDRKSERRVTDEWNAAPTGRSGNGEVGRARRVGARLDEIHTERGDGIDGM